jgi:hypothetical protein
VDNVVIRDLCYVVLAPNIVSTTLPVTTSTLLYKLTFFRVGFTPLYLTFGQNLRRIDFLSAIQRRHVNFFLSKITQYIFFALHNAAYNLEFCLCDTARKEQNIYFSALLQKKRDVYHQMRKFYFFMIYEIKSVISIGPAFGF